MQSLFRFSFCSTVPALAALPALCAAAMVVTAAPVRAQTVIAQSTARSFTSNGAVGQSLTTGADGPFDNLVFNFFNNRNATAPGTLFLLTQAYSGTGNNLSSNTAGYVAQATGASNAYTFSSGITLQSNTQYFFYNNVNAGYDFSVTNSYSGGNSYAGTTVTPFVSSGGPDAAFRLTGTGPAAAAPEPGSFSLLCMGLVGGAGTLGAFRRRRRQRSKAAGTSE